MKFTKMSTCVAAIVAVAVGLIVHQAFAGGSKCNPNGACAAWQPCTDLQSGCPSLICWWCTAAASEMDCNVTGGSGCCHNHVDGGCGKYRFGHCNELGVCVPDAEQPDVECDQSACT